MISAEERIFLEKYSPCGFGDGVFPSHLVKEIAKSSYLAGAAALDELRKPEAHSYESIQKQFACLRKAVVYARHELAIPGTDKEKAVAKMLEDARSEADEIMKEYLK